MTTRTRYFVIASLLVLLVGVGTGLVAYYAGFPMSAFTSAGGPDELRFVPSNATLVAYANVQEVMGSNLRQRLRRVIPDEPTGQKELQNQTGINIETDIDRVVGCFAPPVNGGTGFPGTGLVMARGRFDAVKIEALMREHGALVEDYKGTRLIVADVHPNGDASAGTDTRRNDTLSVAFIEPGLVALGSTPLVRNAIDLKSGGDNVTANEEIMNLVRTLDSGNAWAVGRFDALTSQAKLPSELAQRLPPITWFSATTHINGGFSGVFRAETRDEASATNLRDVVRGFLALAKMQVGPRPELQAMVQSLQLGGTGTTVALSFDVPAAVFDLLDGTIKELAPKQPGI